jgi:UDP-N-acetyl-2-amino-2-deoxyglucuronate dehydrogenase
MESTKNLPIQFAIVGFGNIGRRHAEEISRHKDAELIAIVEIDPEAARFAADKYQVPVYGSLDILFENHKEIDVLNICTPNGLHIPLALEGVKNGFNVLVEKPMGLSKNDCEKLIRLADNLNKQVFCVLQNRYSPPSQFINKMILDHRLGNIYWVAISCYWNRDERYYQPGSWRGTTDMDGGPLYTQFSHFIDLLYWNFGPLKNIQSKFYNFNHEYIGGMEDTGLFQFEFEQGGAGSFTWSTALYHSNLESSITIIGEKGTIKAGGQYMEKIDYFNVEGILMPEIAESLPPNQYGNWVGSAANHAFVIDNVIKALTGAPYEMASAKEAAASVDIIERVYASRKF